MLLTRAQNSLYDACKQNSDMSSQLLYYTTFVILTILTYGWSSLPPLSREAMGSGGTSRSLATRLASHSSWTLNKETDHMIFMWQRTLEKTYRWSRWSVLSGRSLWSLWSLQRKENHIYRDMPHKIRGPWWYTTIKCTACVLQWLQSYIAMTYRISRWSELSRVSRLTTFSVISVFTSYSTRAGLTLYREHSITNGTSVKVYLQ